jgi:hypothetical protein
MNTADIKHLAAFHAQHDTSEKLVCCEWCHKQVPLNQTSPVPTDIDPDTGMAIDEVNVCHDCLPEHDEPDIDDGDSDWEYEADDNSYGTAKWT